MRKPLYRSYTCKFRSQNYINESHFITRSAEWRINEHPPMTIKYLEIYQMGMSLQRAFVHFTVKTTLVSDDLYCFRPSILCILDHFLGKFCVNYKKFDNINITTLHDWLNFRRALGVCNQRIAKQFCMINFITIHIYDRAFVKECNYNKYKNKCMFYIATIIGTYHQNQSKINWKCG